MTSAPEARPRTTWREVVRAAVSFVVGCAALLWLLAAWYIWTFRCDESCSGDQAESWQWTGQAVVAFTGAVATVVAISLGPTRHDRAYRAARLVAGTGLLVWLSWLLGWGAV